MTALRLSTLAAALLFFTSAMILRPLAAIADQPADNRPITVVSTGVNEVIALFDNKEMPLTERRERLRELAQKYFDFRDMARSVLGYHWRELRPEQRDRFVPLFSRFIEVAYLSKLHESSVRKVQEEVKTTQIRFTKETLEGPDYAQVDSIIAWRDQKDPIEVNYRMHRVDGQWRIYDVTVDAISVIANFRNQFNRVINNDGFDKLMADLQAKQQQLQAYMDHPPVRSE